MPALSNLQTQSEGADLAEKASSSQASSAAEQPLIPSAKGHAEGAIIQKHLGRTRSKKSGRMGAIATVRLKPRALLAASLPRSEVLLSCLVPLA